MGNGGPDVLNLYLWEEETHKVHVLTIEVLQF